MTNAAGTMDFAESVMNAPRHLTAADRCDNGSCGAQARVVVVMPSGNDLQICLHQYKHHKNAFPAGTQTFEQLDDL